MRSLARSGDGVSVPKFGPHSSGTYDHKEGSICWRPLFVQPRRRSLSQNPTDLRLARRRKAKRIRGLEPLRSPIREHPADLFYSEPWRRFSGRFGVFLLGPAKDAWQKVFAFCGEHLRVRGRFDCTARTFPT